MVIFVVGFLPVILAIGAFVIDGANLFEHRRHLQLQADAGALATAQEFMHCFIDEDAANDAIEQQAIEYSGELHNAQVGAADAQSRVETRINATSFTASSFSDGEPCDTGFADVKLTETDSPPFFPFVGSHDVRARARVQLFKLLKSDKLLPIAVPDPDPQVARAFFVDESKPTSDPGYVLASVPLTRHASEGGLAIWDNSGTNPGTGGQAVPVSVPITAADVGVRIALGGSTSSTCGGNFVDCYDKLSTRGIVHIRGWTGAGTAAPKTPIARSVSLTPGACGDPYFSNAPATGCNVGVTAAVDFGASPITLGATLSATMGGTTVPLTFDSGTNAWSSTTSLPVGYRAGPLDVSLSWTIARNADGTACTPTKDCRGNLGVVQRHFAANPDRSGPIMLARLSEGGTAWPNSLERCSAVLATCSHTLVVKIGIEPELGLSDLDDPPVRLRVTGGSQNQSLDCDPDVQQLADELADGCQPEYTRWTGSPPCPDSQGALWGSPEPWECVAVQTGSATSQVTKGLNRRILGSETASTCPPERQNHWPDYPAGDRRIVLVMITPFGSFLGSGNTTVPVLRFATFYITGWMGQGGNFQNPCLSQGDEMPTNPAEIVGRYIQYVDLVNEGGASDELCDISSTDPCTAVLVQ